MTGRLRDAKGRFIPKQQPAPANSPVNGEESDHDAGAYVSADEESRTPTPAPDELAVELIQLAMAEETKPELRLFNPRLAKLQQRADREGKPDKIDAFDGSPAAYKKFTSDVDLRFLYYPTRYSNDDLRIADVMQNCTGRASNWCLTVLTSENHDCAESYNAFVNGFTEQFKDRSYITRMTAQWMKKHTAGPVTKFTEEFEEAAHALGHDRSAHAATYISHMKDDMKMSIARAGTIDSTNYDQLKTFCMKVDAETWQYREKKPAYSALPNAPSTVAVATNNSYTVPATTGTAAKPIHWSKLTPEQRLRQKEYRKQHGLCGWCGAKEHDWDNCPPRIKKFNVNNRVQLNNMNVEFDEETGAYYNNAEPDTKAPVRLSSLQSWRRPADPVPRHKLEVNGSVGGVEATALVDSGAEENFVTKELANEMNIKRSSVLNASIVAPDGHVIIPPGEAQIITADCTVDGLDTVECTFVTAPLVKRDAILGHPFLEATNPDIDWTTGVVRKRTRPKKKIIVPYYLKPGKPAPIQAVAGRRQPAARLNPGKNLKILEQKTAAAAHKRMKQAYTSAKATYKRIKEMTARVRTSLRQHTQPDVADDTTEEDNTAPIDWEDPYHALELNALIKQFEPDSTFEVPEGYERHADAFDDSQASNVPMRRPGLDHKIELIDVKKQQRSRLYKMTETEDKLLREYIDDELSNGRIRPSKSPCAAPVMFKSRPHSTELRLCVDYRQLNANTVKNAYPLPLFDDFVSKLHGAKYFTRLDLRNAFHQLRIADGDEWKTAFTTKYGLYEYNVMPFGLCNAPASFQSWIDSIFHEMSDELICYLDDIMIFGSTLDELRERTHRVLDLLQANHLYVNLKKSEFEVTTTKFLGFIIQHNHITVDPARVALITEWPVPKTLKQVQSFLGFINFYRRFIERFSAIAFGLTALTRKDKQQRRFELGTEGLNSFHSLQESFTGSKVLRMWDPDLPGLLETDASCYAISGILSQVVDGVKVPIGFYSKKHSPEESRYGTPDQELMAIVYSLLHWRHYLEGAKHQTTVHSDHANLRTFNTTANLNRRQTGWWSKVASFDFVVKHVPGSKNPADLPSRREDYKPSPDDPLPEVHTFLRLAAMAQVPPDLYNALATATASDEFAQSIAPDDANFERVNDLVVYKDSATYVPAQLRNRILELCHDSPLAGHQGRHRTLEKCKRDWYWPRMSADVKRYVKGCRVCNDSKNPRHRPYGLLSPLPIPESRWSRVHIDFLTDLPTTARGHNAILTIVDALTKMAHFIPVKLKKDGDTVNAQRAADIFRRECIRLHGVPGTLVSDRDTRFLNKFWTAITQRLGIIQQPTTAYHSTANGQGERPHQTIEALLRAYCSADQSDWDLWLDTCEFAYNDSVSSATGVTPFYANYGYNPARQTHPESTSADADFASHAWIDKQDDIITRCKTKLQHTRAAMHRNYDPHREELTFNVGDLVRLNTKDLALEGTKSRKLAPRFVGPFRVIAIPNPDTYELDIPASMDIKHPVYHVSKLERFHDTNVDLSQPPIDEPRLWRERVTEPIQRANTPYRIIGSRATQRGKQLHYHVEFLDTQQQQWIPKTFLGFAGSDDELIDRFHRDNPTAARPHDYIPEADRTWEDLPEEIDDSPRRGRPSVQFTRNGEYAVAETKPYGKKGLKYRIYNTTQPTIHKWMTQRDLARIIGADKARQVIYGV